MIRSGDEIGLCILRKLVGMSSILITRASNPYLRTFDYTWAIFLPIEFINFWLLKRQKNRRYNLIMTPLEASETQ